jgi:hypothetical protein
MPLTPSRKVSLAMARLFERRGWRQPGYVEAIEHLADAVGGRRETGADGGEHVWLTLDEYQVLVEQFGTGVDPAPASCGCCEPPRAADD